MEIKNRKIEMFRTYYDPSIGPKPMQAFSRKAMPNAEMELCPLGVYVKLTLRIPGNKDLITEHIVPYTNVQMIKLAPLEPKPDPDAKE